LVTIGDHVTLEGLLQTHLFEDRVMKLGTIDIEEGVSIGSEATVLYDTRVGAWASVGDASLVMKHETLSPGRRYRGLPVENVEEAVMLAPFGDAEASRPVARRRRSGSDSWVGQAS